jgi:hypothetical protein
MDKALVILENLDEAKYYLNFLLHNKDAKGCSILSLSPNIRAYLVKNGIKSISSADVFDEESHKAVMDKCEEIEGFIKKHIKDKGIKLPEEYFVNIYFHYLRLILRHFLWDIEMLDRCLSGKSYKKVFAFKYGEVTTSSPWIEDDQLYMGKVAEQVCKNLRIDFVPLSLPLPSIKRAQIKFHDGWYYKLCNKASFFLTRIAAKIFSKRKSLLVPAFKYNLNLVCDDLLAKDKELNLCTFYLGKEGVLEVVHSLGILFYASFNKKINNFSFSYPLDFILPIMTFARAHISKYDNLNPRRYLNETLMALEIEKVKEITYKGINFFDWLRQKIEEDLIPYMLNSHLHAYGLEKALEAARPNYVISQMNGEIYGALGYITKEFNIPSVLISHGSHVLHKDKYAAKEHEILAKNILVGDYQYCAVQSPFAAEMAKKLAGDAHKIIPIKPVLWGRKIENKKKKNKIEMIIVHASGFKLRHNRRYLYETADEFLYGLRDLCEVVSSYPNIKLIIKIRPDVYELSIETIKSFLPRFSNIIIETSGQFQAVLNKADLLISFSSTTIEEALSNNIPVLLYGGEGRYAHIPVEPFSDQNNDIINAVTFVKNKQDLIEYFNILDQKTDGFSVPLQKFDSYRYMANEAVDFTEWFVGKLMDKQK